MPRQHTVTVYTFEELPTDKAKERARDAMRTRVSEDPDLLDHVIEDAINIADKIGITVKQNPARSWNGRAIMMPGISWSLHVQGSGANFSGRYVYADPANVKAEAPVDTELHRIADGLAEVQARYNNTLTAAITAGRDAHSRDTEIEIRDNQDEEPTQADAEIVRELLRDFMDWIYNTLNTEWDYQTGDEAINERLTDGDEEYYEDGKRVCR